MKEEKQLQGRYLCDRLMMSLCQIHFLTECELGKVCPFPYLII